MFGSYKEKAERIPEGIQKLKMKKIYTCMEIQYMQKRCWIY